MKKYRFASVRGADFESEGISPIDAWSRLVEREKDNGTLWRCLDEYRNKYAIKNQGFTKLAGIAYKEIQ